MYSSPWPTAFFICNNVFDFHDFDYRKITQVNIFFASFWWPKERKVTTGMLGEKNTMLMDCKSLKTESLSSKREGTTQKNMRDNVEKKKWLMLEKFGINWNEWHRTGQNVGSLQTVVEGRTTNKTRNDKLEKKNKKTSDNMKTKTIFYDLN